MWLRRWLFRILHDPLTAVIAISSKVFDVSPNCLKKLATSLGIVPRDPISNPYTLISLSWNLSLKYEMVGS